MSAEEKRLKAEEKRVKALAFLAESLMQAKSCGALYNVTAAESETMMTFGKLVTKLLERELNRE